jgi:hypothetical protein
MTEETEEEARSIRQRGRAVARRVTEPLNSATDVITGRGVERQVAEYSETFTQVVLGLHEDLATAKRRIADLERAVAESTTHFPTSETKQHLLNVAAVSIALAALGVALWAAL